MNQLLQTFLRRQCDFWRDIAPNRNADGNANDIHILLCVLDTSAIMFAFKERADK